MAEDQNTAKNLVVKIEIGGGVPLGAVPNDKLIITKIQPGTVAEGKLIVGDQVLKVNDVATKNVNHFFDQLREATPCASIAIFRDAKRWEELESHIYIPLERQKLIQKRDGFVYFLAKFVYVAGGPKLGLGIKHYQNRVLVSRCDEGSIAASQLQVGDHLLDIDESPVSDKDVARNLLVKGLKANGVVTSVVERPETAEAKQWVQMALTTEVKPPSVQMKSDVKVIAKKILGKLGQPQQPPKSILVSGAAQKRVQINDEHKSHVIATDHEGKVLKAVKSAK